MINYELSKTEKIAYRAINTILDKDTATIAIQTVAIMAGLYLIVVLLFCI